MLQQTLKRKKKKLRTDLLLISYDTLPQEEKHDTLAEIRIKLRKIFKNHIGKNNSISPFELFQKVFDENPENVDFFKRRFWWEVINEVLTRMRQDGDVFVINARHSLYVLQSQDEADIYKKRLDSTIVALEGSKKRADEWVRNKKWRNI